jgi:hypothetical protein
LDLKKLFMNGMSNWRRKGISALCLFVTLVCWIGVVTAPVSAIPGDSRRNDRKIQQGQLHKLLIGLGALAASITLAMWPRRGLAPV